MRGAGGGSIAKCLTKILQAVQQSERKNNNNQVGIETAMEGIFIEMHSDAKRQGNAKPK